MEDKERDILKTLYGQLCESYHKVDDFRGKLLGFLPFASGVAIYGLFLPVKKDDKDKVVQELIENYETEIGWFGMLVTFGLLLYELKGIQKCTGFIKAGQEIERKLLGALPKEERKLLQGKYTVLGTPGGFWNQVASEPVASAVVYGSVMMAWAFVALQDDRAVRVGGFTFLIVVLFWQLCAGLEPIKARIRRKWQKISNWLVKKF